MHGAARAAKETGAPGVPTCAGRIEGSATVTTTIHADVISSSRGAVGSAINFLI